MCDSLPISLSLLLNATLSPVSCSIPHADPLYPCHPVSHLAARCPQSFTITSINHPMSTVRPTPAALSVLPALGLYVWEEQMALLRPGSQNAEEGRTKDVWEEDTPGPETAGILWAEVLRVQLSIALRAGGARWCLFKGSGLSDIRQSWSCPSRLVCIL